MPYKNETSSFLATLEFNKAVNDGRILKNFYIDTDKNISGFLSGLDLFYKSNQELSNTINQNSALQVYNDIYCIDGSIVTIGQENYGDYNAIQVGGIRIDLKHLESIKDTEGDCIYNPEEMAKIYNNKSNIILKLLIPHRDIYVLNSNNEPCGIKESMKNSIRNFVNLNDQFKEVLRKKEILEIFNSAYQQISHNINEEHSIYGTKKECKEIMLLLENLISLYFVEATNKSKTPSLIILDGRMQNKYLHDKPYVHQLINNIDCSILMSVQKTGLINSVLAFFHNYLKNIFDSKDGIKSIEKTHPNVITPFKNYLNGDGLFFYFSPELKQKAGLTRSEYNTSVYGVECCYISPAPLRKEFVFMLPAGLFEQQNQIIMPQIISGILKLFKKYHINSFLNDRGAFIANAISHSSVSLNKSTITVPNIQYKTRQPIEFKNTLKP